MPPLRKRLVWGVLLVLVCIGVFAWLRAHVVVRLEVDDDVRIALRTSLPFRTQISQAVDVAIHRDIETRAKLGDFTIDLDESIDVPVKTTVSVPIDSEVLVDQPLDLSLDVPLDTVLTEKELDLNQLTIPIEQDVFVDDDIHVQASVPIDTTVTTTLGVKVPVKATIPIKVTIPIRQKLRVKDQLRLALKNVRVPLKMVVPVRARIPIHQTFRVRGQIVAPVAQNVRVSIKKQIRPKSANDIPVTVKLEGKVPADIRGEFVSEAELREDFAARVGTLQVSAKNVSFDLAR